MKYQKFFIYKVRLGLVCVLFLILNQTIFSQQRRLGLDETPKKNSKDEKISKESNLKHFILTENNRRFGLPVGESQLEIAITPKIIKRPKSLLKIAQNFLSNGQLEHAISSYQKAIKAKESLDLAYFGLGYTLLKLNKFDEAIIAFKESIKINPNNNKSYLNLGVALHSINKFDEAISFYKLANKINKNSDAEFNLAVAFFHQNNINSAIEYYQKAIETRKLYPAAYNNLGLAYEIKEDFNSAFTSFQLAIKQSNNSYPLANYNLGRFYFNQGKFFPEAVEQLQLAIRKQNNFPEVFLMLGNIFLVYENQSGNKDSIIQAKAYYEKAIELNKNYSLAYENLAIAYSRLGENKTAFANFRKALNTSTKYSSFLIENLISTITNSSSFFINDEFSRAEGPKRLKQYPKENQENQEIIASLLKNYEQLPNELKSLVDIRYCFGKIYLSVNNLMAAANELNYALELSKGEDKEVKDLLISIYRTVN
ncbi:MAG: tetratricopeptide repeat protein [Acidobacteria bacterium]|nr:tetratricopeptide repeat protein [Acidobacteriota bacterium]